MKSLKYFFFVVLMAVIFTACDKNEDPNLIEVDTQGYLSESDGISNYDTRATLRSNVTYYSTPSIGGSVPNSSSDVIVGDKCGKYHGGVLAAELINQNGNSFTVRITKQDGGAFLSQGTAYIKSGSLCGSILVKEDYAIGDEYIDLTFNVDISRGVAHFYPMTTNQSNSYRYYAEPLLVYTEPMFLRKNTYTEGELLGTVNGVRISASGPGLLGKDLRYQCVAFCKSYYSTIYGKSIGKVGYAKNLFRLAPGKGLKAYKNGGSVAPRPGDILCLGKGTKDDNGEYYGHVAIIIEVSDSEIKIAHQNGGMNMDAIGHSFNRSGNSVTAGDYYEVQGWVRMP